MSGRHRAFLALGSNIGDRVAHLRTAVAALPDVDAVSAVYETPPVSEIEQDRYLNMVVRLDTELDARALLEVCREREAAAERVRVVRWGPRTLDVDVLWVDGETVEQFNVIASAAELYDTTQDWTQAKDLPKQMPDKLHELQRLWLI